MAIDGKLHDLIEEFGAFHIGSSSPGEWLEIDMGRREKLCKLQLFFQTRNLYTKQPERRANIEGRVGDSRAVAGYTRNVICGTLSSLPYAFTTTLKCNVPLFGKYIVIRQAGEELWDIDEVNAFRYSQSISEASCDVGCLGMIFEVINYFF